LIAPEVEVIEATPPGGPPPAGAGSLLAPSVALEMLEALVASVEQELAALERSAHAGCVDDGTPAVDMALIHWWLVATRDSTPPSVDPVGVGRLAAGRVPVTPVASGIDGRSPATSEHGANEVAERHAPITWWEVCEFAAPMAKAGVVVAVETGHVSHGTQEADTLVTVPLPPPALCTHVAALWLHVHQLPVVLST